MKPRVRSMTGFARAQRSNAAAEVSVTLKSLNHRGLDVHFHTPAGTDPFEHVLRAAIKKAVLRGHVDVRVIINRFGSQGAAGFNEGLLRSYIAAFQKAADEFGFEGAVPDLNMAFRLPGMFEEAAEAEPERELQPLLLEALHDALAALNEFRAREGAELAAFIQKHNKLVASACCQIGEIRSRAVPLFQQRLNERLKELLRNSNVDQQRLAQEAALLADRSDIGEEVARLDIHSKQLDEILDVGGEVGKKIDFLLQEMNRETNTILSKTSGIGELGLKITDLALGIKADIEKIREQALNLE
ncbi:MAG: YicC family protein [Acidobacteriaceae bacterium]|nr:YicC family protein [Acidobacteriaceae bacterium]